MLEVARAAAAANDDPDVGGGDEGGLGDIDGGLLEEDRRRCRWTSPKNTLPMLAIDVEFKGGCSPLRYQ